jgi:hypothetical protein
MHLKSAVAGGGWAFSRKRRATKKTLKLTFPIHHPHDPGVGGADHGSGRLLTRDPHALRLPQKAFFVDVQRLRPEPHDVNHIAQLLPSCTLDLEKDLRLGPPNYPNQKATISKRQPSADEQPDNPPTSLRIRRSKDQGYGFKNLTLDLSFLFLPGPLVFGHNLIYP